MIKIKDITSINVDDFIRERKRMGSKYIRWTSNSFKYLNGFYGAIVCSKHGTSCMICGEKGVELTDKDSGLTFMGIKHYWR